MTMIEEYIRENVRRRSEAVEKACERMLVSPVPVGVRVDLWEDGDWSVRLWYDEPFVVSEFHHVRDTPDVLVR